MTIAITGRAEYGDEGDGTPEVSIFHSSFLREASGPGFLCTVLVQYIQYDLDNSSCEISVHEYY